MASIDSLNTRRELSAGGKTYHYYSLPAAEEAGIAGISQLPVSLKVLLENQLRFEDGISVGEDDLRAFASWVNNRGGVEHEISFRPARVLMQDFTGVPAVVDLAAMRDALAKLGADAAKINPLVPVDLVIDHSVMVDYFGTAASFEPQRRAVSTSATSSATGSCAGARRPSTTSASCRPGTGICHQVNLEYLAADGVWSTRTLAAPATMTSPTPTLHWSAPTATPPW